MAKHLLQQDRLYIERELNAGRSIRSIALTLDRAVSTISREVRARRIEQDTGAYGRIKNRCIHKNSCTLRSICEDKPNCTRLCRSCKLCNSICNSFVELTCPKLEQPPYVCNGCDELKQCVLNKYFYKAIIADSNYRKRLSDSRSGFNLTLPELNYIDELCSPLIKNGQSVYHIIATHRDDMICSERTLYRLINASTLSARNIDMPRVCRMRPRKPGPKTAKIDKACREGRTMKDFEAFKKANPDTGLAEIDSVIGKVGGKLLLTIHIKSIDFMLAFLRNHNTAASVGEIFAFLRRELPKEVYRKLFYVILTDNGSEFSNPSLIENDDNGNTISHLFYCDPSSPYQKPNVELNHEFIRRCIPKGTSMDNLTQRDIDRMMSHINSYGREKFAGLSPTKMFISMFGEDILHLLRQDVIPSEKIVLNDSIFNL